MGAFRGFPCAAFSLSSVLKYFLVVDSVMVCRYNKVRFEIIRRGKQNGKKNISAACEAEEEETRFSGKKEDQGRPQGVDK